MQRCQHSIQHLHEPVDMVQLDKLSIACINIRSHSFSPPHHHHHRSFPHHHPAPSPTRPRWFPPSPPFNPHRLHRHPPKPHLHPPHHYAPSLKFCPLPILRRPRPTGTLAAIFGLDLPRFIKHTPHTAANHTAGMPITDLTILQTVRRRWNSYWLRHLAHGHNTGLFFTKHISETMFASEFFSALRSRKIDLDSAAIAYCHQRSIPAHTKQKALSALVTEFVDYMQDVSNESSSTTPTPSQHNPEGHQLKAPQQTDPATAQRLIALEHQLAAANLTINHLRGQPTPLPSQPTTTHTQPASTTNTHPDNTAAHSRDFRPIAPRNLQPHLESRGHESAHCKTPPPADTHSPPPVVDITSSPVPGASQETALYSPSPHYQDDDSKAGTANQHDATHPHPLPTTHLASHPHQHTTTSAPHRPATDTIDRTSQSSKPVPDTTSKKFPQACHPTWQQPYFA